jgi:microcystin-dependent protein
MADPFLGEIKMFAGNFAPVGWNFCDGTVLQIGANDALFALLGTTYGGDGVSTFALPDFRGRIPVHVSAALPLGQPGGSETVSITPAQLPAHSHQISVSSDVGSQSTPDKNLLAQSDSIKVYSTVNPGLALAGQSITNSAGSSLPHDNVQPYLCLNFIIALQGIFPPQN